jgi:hypothetical protein
MKKIKYFICALVALAGLQANAQDDDFWGEFWETVLSNYSDTEVGAIQIALDTDSSIAVDLSNAYLDIVTPIYDYGNGFEYVGTLPDGATQVGFCQGWTANIFYMTKKGENAFTEYIKFWEVGSSKIVTEKGYKYLVVYPVDGYAFEKRSWYGSDAETDYSEVNSIKFYMDWSKQSGLIDQMNNAFNTWGMFNTAIRE